MMKMAYGRTPDVADPQNANPNWRAGYAVGRFTDDESLQAIATEWLERGKPSGESDSRFAEWKIGFWAGRFSRIEDAHGT